jgi:hypothetical protein
MKLLREYIRSLINEATYQSHAYEPSAGDVVVNVNPKCTHEGSIGKVVKINVLPGDAGKTASYECLNDGPTWNSGDILEKTLDQLAPGPQ